MGGRTPPLTRQGRRNHFLSTHFDRASRLLARLHGRIHAATGGRLGGRMFGARCFRLTVRGRVSGEPRSVMLILARRGDDLVVCGSNGGNPKPPAWWRNLVAAGEAVVQVGGDSWKVTPRVVVGDERDECWRLLAETYADFPTYQALTDRPLPVAVLERTPPGR